VSERYAGRISILDVSSGTISQIEDGPNDVFIKDNGGMLDVILHPNYASNGWIYYSYSAGTQKLNTTVVERARLQKGRFVERERIFAALPWFHNSIVYGCRLAFKDGYLFVTTGDRWDLRHLSQNAGNHLGKIMRLHDDGSAPADNPYVNIPGAMPEVWSIGVRNAQGLTVHPETGVLWEHEHGPLGGDEVNIIKMGANYGWPIISYGKEYTGEPIGQGLTERDFRRHGQYSLKNIQRPIHTYIPSIAPSDMTFYTGDKFPAWYGNLFIGAMALHHLNRLVIKGETVVHEERLFADKGWRVRLVEQGPDGFLYIGVDDGMILRLVPAEIAP
jgi:glucose/arabinose dehydrogenase